MPCLHWRMHLWPASFYMGSASRCRGATEHLVANSGSTGSKRHHRGLFIGQGAVWPALIHPLAPFGCGHRKHERGVARARIYLARRDPCDARDKAKDHPGALIVATPSALGTSWARKFGTARQHLPLAGWLCAACGAGVLRTAGSSCRITRIGPVSTPRLRKPGPSASLSHTDTRPFSASGWKPKDMTQIVETDYDGDTLDAPETETAAPDGLLRLRSKYYQRPALALLRHQPLLRQVFNSTRGLASNPFAANGNLRVTVGGVSGLRFARPAWPMMRGS